MTFVKYFRNTEESQEGELKEALVCEVKAVNEALGGKDYLDGDLATSADMALYPKIRHCLVAAKHFKGFQVPAECGAFLAYADRFSQRESAKATYYPDESIIEGWAPKVGISISGKL